MIYYIFECGHKREKSPLGQGPDVQLDGLCHTCKVQRIGQKIEFLRLGQPPTVSRNHRDGTTENGVSVYEIVNGKADLVGWHFGFLDRPGFRGQGTIVGWGSDGEPLVEILSIKRISGKAKATLIAD